MTIHENSHVVKLCLQQVHMAVYEDHQAVEDNCRKLWECLRVWQDILGHEATIPTWESLPEKSKRLLLRAMEDFLEQHYLKYNFRSRLR